MTTLRLVHLLARRDGTLAALGLLAILAFAPPPTEAAVVEAWVQRYNGPADFYDVAHAVAVDGSGNVVVTGITDLSCPDDSCSGDYYTAKYAAADGALLWERRYNGPRNRLDQAQAVAVDGSGNVVVTGVSDADIAFGGFYGGDYYTAKYAAADGALLWENRFNGVGQAVAVDDSGNVVVTGHAGADFYTAKYAAAHGALLWEKRYNGPGDGPDFAKAVAVDGGSNVVVTGYSWSTYLGNTSIDYYTAKYAATDGALLWEKRFPAPLNGSDDPCGLAVDGSGNAVVTGYSGTIKYLANGTGVWTNRAGATALAVDASGNVVVTGAFYNSSDSDSHTAKYAAANGALLWEKRHTNFAATAVAVDDSGNVVMTGSRSSYNGTNSDYYTAKYAAADGALLWERRYNGPANRNDYASSLALGRNGMVAVTGTSSGDYATVLYRENLPPLAIELVSTGVRLRFHGVPGHSYNIERAPAVAGPWSTIATLTVPISRIIEYVDQNAPDASAFYRTSAL